MLNDKEILDILSNISTTLSKASSIVRANWIIAPIGVSTHPSATDRALIFDVLDAVAHAANALHMELRAEDHPEMLEQDDDRRDDMECPF